MSSPDPVESIRPQTIGWILDPALGFFVWAAHFLAIYIVAALSCALGLGTSTGDNQAMFLWVLIGLTVLGAFIVLVHGWVRLKQYRAGERTGFRTMVTLGADALAAVAMLLQLFPLLMVPLCV